LIGARVQLDVVSRLVRWAALGVAVLPVGCDGVDANAGLSEPIVVAGAQFFPGTLPSGTKGPAISVVSIPNATLVSGQAGIPITGDAASTAYSVLFRFATIGSGYWVVPVGPLDFTNPGQNSWSATVSFSRLIDPGTYDLDFVASDQSNKYGPVNSTALTFKSPLPTGHVVFSLKWDSNADLDLHVLSPDGTELSPKHWFSTSTVTRLADGGFDPGVGFLDRDSNANCVEDAWREEDVSFKGDPDPGTYVFSVDEFSACGTPATNFVFTTYLDGQEQTAQTRIGALLAEEADDGASAGLTLLTQTF
jgi:hypothetical protein